MPKTNHPCRRIMAYHRADWNRKFKSHKDFTLARVSQNPGSVTKTEKPLISRADKKAKSGG